MNLIEKYLTSTAEGWRDAIRRDPSAINARGLASAPYCCIEEFVLDQGQAFNAAPPKKPIRRGKMGECYENTWDFVAKNRRLTYVEGIALHGMGVGLVHAWAVDSDGNVTDPTWQYDASTEYFGVPFEWMFLNRTIAKTCRFGLLENARSAIFRGSWKFKRAEGFVNGRDLAPSEVQVAS